MRTSHWMRMAKKSIYAYIFRNRRFEVVSSVSFSSYISLSNSASSLVYALNR